MVDPIDLEKAILGAITGVRVDDWVQFTMGLLRARLNEFDGTLVKASDAEIVDCICSLEAESLIATRKNDGGRVFPFARAQAEEDRYRHQFFWIGSFELKATHEGRKKVALKEKAQTGAVKVIDSVQEMDDRLPLYRRKFFDAELESSVKEALNNGFPLALVMVDVDKFSEVNNTHGHPTGDEVLLAISATIANRVRGKGKAYRYGGEEIAIILPNYLRIEAAALAESIRMELEQTQISEKKLNVTASFGVATAPKDARGGKELLELADAALRSAKNLGRNLVRVVGDTERVEERGESQTRKQPNLAQAKRHGPNLKYIGAYTVSIQDSLGQGLIERGAHKNAIVIRFRNEANGDRTVGATVRALLVYKNAQQEIDSVRGFWLETQSNMYHCKVDDRLTLIAGLLIGDDFLAYESQKNIFSTYITHSLDPHTLRGFASGTLFVRLTDANDGHVLYEGQFAVTKNPLGIVPE